MNGLLEMCAEQTFLRDVISYICGQTAGTRAVDCELTELFFTAAGRQLGHWSRGTGKFIFLISLIADQWRSSYRTVAGGV
jgi:hypothetical protein